jgi:hypothetical protein
LNRSIIDLVAREQSNARISRQQGGHCRWRVAAGGDRMWPICAMRCVLGAVRWRSPGFVTVDTPAPASCMESLPGCGQNSGRLLSASQKREIPKRKTKCYLREFYCKAKPGLRTRRPADPSSTVYMNVLCECVYFYVFRSLTLINSHNRTERTQVTHSHSHSQPQGKGQGPGPWRLGLGG